MEGEPIKMPPNGGNFGPAASHRVLISSATGSGLLRDHKAQRQVAT
jgi:hypothetical protein